MAPSLRARGEGRERATWGGLRERWLTGAERNKGREREREREREKEEEEVLLTAYNK